MADGLFFGGFMLVWFVLFFGGMAGLVLGIVALISVAQTPTEAFGPWWDNTKTAWLAGIAISYLIPAGLWVTAIYWFRTGKRGLERDGLVGRPFWIGPIKPYPPSPGGPWYPPPTDGTAPGWYPPSPTTARGWYPPAAGGPVPVPAPDRSTSDAPAPPGAVREDPSEP